MGPSKVAAAIVAALAGTLLVASPAYAVTAPVRYENTSISDTSTTKVVQVSCPSGQSVFGAGGKVNNGGGDVILTGIMPGAALDTVTVGALARAGHKGAWSVTAYAICHAPGDQAPERVSAVGPLWSATATCPTGKLVYGNGFAIANATGSAFLDGIVPDAYLGHVDVHARGTDIGAFNLFAYAICALPMSRAQRTQMTVGGNLFTPTTVTAPKPDMFHDYGSWIFSAGAQIIGGGDVHIDGLTPTPALDGGWARAIAVPAGSQVRAAGGSSPAAAGDDYSLTGFATCIGSWY
jgi:hypothetical protein